MSISRYVYISPTNSDTPFSFFQFFTGQSKWYWYKREERFNCSSLLKAGGRAYHWNTMMTQKDAGASWWVPTRINLNEWITLIIKVDNHIKFYNWVFVYFSVVLELVAEIRLSYSWITLTLRQSSHILKTPWVSGLVKHQTEPGTNPSGKYAKNILSQWKYNNLSKSGRSLLEKIAPFLIKRQNLWVHSQLWK